MIFYRDHTFPPQALYAATATVARYMGAAGKLSVRGRGNGSIVTADGTLLAATSVGLAEGSHGIAMAHPEGVRVVAKHGLPARRMDCVFESGRWWVHWQIGDAGDELMGLHEVLPPEAAGLLIDPARLFAFPETVIQQSMKAV